MSNIQADYIRDLQTEFAQTEEELVAARQVLTQREDSLRAAVADRADRRDREECAPDDGRRRAAPRR